MQHCSMMDALRYGVGMSGVVAVLPITRKRWVVSCLPAPIWRSIRKRPLASAIGSALFVRVLLSFWLCSVPPVINLTKGYIETAAAIVSGKGLIMPAGNNGTVDVVEFLR